MLIEIKGHLINHIIVELNFLKNSNKNKQFKILTLIQSLYHQNIQDNISNGDTIFFLLQCNKLNNYIIVCITFKKNL